MANQASRDQIITDKTNDFYQRLANQYLDSQCYYTMRQNMAVFCAANWDKLKPIFDAQVNYAANEDLPVQEFWVSKIKKALR